MWSRTNSLSCVAIGNGQLNQMSMSEVGNALDCMHDKQAVLYRSAYGAHEPGIQRAGRHERNARYCLNSSGGGISDPLTASYSKGTGTRNGNEREFIAMDTERKYCVRRLTPLECCRLQGFPDWWTDGVEGSDSAKYKMWGNGMALPCVLYVMEGIKEALTE